MAPEEANTPLSRDLTPRQIVAGIAPYYSVDALQGRRIVVVSNLAPRKLRGVESNGMLLAASAEGGSALIAPQARTRRGRPSARRYVRSASPFALTVREMSATFASCTSSLPVAGEAATIVAARTSRQRKRRRRITSEDRSLARRARPSDEGRGAPCPYSHSIVAGGFDETS